ncbi:acetyl-CoA carboxylase biotin carboxyl carrier protein [Pantoea phytobeneficialis]|uniref:Acetyl-CoA carboxylase biotin carboxyl carrier protein subunit n=1 Tax=Pantoea phytobeneficialis TaxID=2052056 RepID=A0AAP9H266_9GAMM|nr:biotin/lipoyl-containing protein [Pantoea phytobeneficialis]MDO6405850.1 biotin/lipoyl-containing protein [Pantoea phytobeneficialis]QGR05255.1 acetyl-CoA carboxylase biotin carboxyl carrier protein subunit [Pantoea phytobeneficialis]
MEKTAIPLPTLRAVARKMQTAGLSHLTLGGKAWSVKMTFAAVPPSTPQPVPAPPNALRPVGAPMPGTLRLRHPLSQQDFVQPGQVVKPDDVLALVQVGPLYLPVISPVNGTVQNVVINDGSPVEYEEEILIIHDHNQE